MILSNSVCDAASLMKRWLGVPKDCCVAVTSHGMGKKHPFLFQHTTYDPQTTRQTIILSHSSTVRRPLLGSVAPKPRQILEAHIEFRGAGLWGSVDRLDVTSHLNTRLSSFTSSACAMDAPCARDYICLALQGRSLGKFAWDTPVLRCLPRHQKGDPYSSSSDLVLLVTTMDLSELEFRKDDRIRL